MSSQQLAMERNEPVLAQIEAHDARYGGGIDLHTVNVMDDYALAVLKRQRTEYDLHLRHVGAVAWQHLLEDRDRGLFNMSTISCQNERNVVALRCMRRGMVVTDLIDANIVGRDDEFMGNVYGFRVDLESVTYASLRGIRSR